jgi:hypothetical protein
VQARGVLQLLTGAHLVENLAKGVSEEGPVVEPLQLVFHYLESILVHALLTPHEEMQLIPH